MGGYLIITEHNLGFFIKLKEEKIEKRRDTTGTIPLYILICSSD